MASREKGYGLTAELQKKAGDLPILAIYIYSLLFSTERWQIQRPTGQGRHRLDK